MKPQEVRVDDLPPPHVPFRFYLTAPLFGLAAAVLLWIDAPYCWISRWSGTLLAAVHLVTLGVIAMVMIGSLFQVVVVLGGRAIPGARWVPAVVHLALTSGVVLLCATMRTPDLDLWGGALGCLGVAFVVFGTALATVLVKRSPGRQSIPVVRLAALAMLATVATGFFLAASRGWPGLHDGFRQWTDIHVAWGLAGAVALLVMAVSFQVIPMFQVAPAFAPRWALSTAVALFAGLVALSLVALSLAPAPWPTAGAATIVCGALASYAVHALLVLHRRTRRRTDALNAFLRLSLGCLISGAVVAWLVTVPPIRAWLGTHAHTAEMLVGVLAIGGFALSILVGMLLKITAFLVFVHLQRQCLTSPDANRHLLAMTDVVTEPAARWQFRLHAATTAALIGAALLPEELGSTAAALLAADFGCLLGLLWAGAWRHRRAAARIRAALG